VWAGRGGMVVGSGERVGSLKAFKEAEWLVFSRQV